MTLTDAAPSSVLEAEPPALASIPKPAAAADEKPARKSRSGTSGAERARRAREAGGSAPKRDRQPAAPKLPPLEKRLQEALELVGTLVGTFVDPYDGAVLTHNAERAAGVLAGIAARKPAFARTLERLLSAGDNVDGVALLVGMLLPILVNHGLVPAKFGVLATVMGTAPAAPDADADALRSLFAGAGATVPAQEQPAA